MARAGVSVVRMTAIVASKRLGISSGIALMTDGRDVRFRVIARDPITVRTLGEEAKPGDHAAIEAWFAAAQGEA